MIFMLTATEGESESCTPNCDIGDPIGPIQKGTTYIVRPRIAPSNFLARRSFISDGSIQLLVGPASPFLREQMYVRSSTRATSDGCDRARNEFGRFSSFSLINVPASTISRQRRSYSRVEPSHQCTRSGLQCSTMSDNQLMSP